MFKSASERSVDLTDKVVLIVNYNDSEIGRSLCDEFLHRGCKVCVTREKIVDSNESTFGTEKFRAFQLNTANYDEVLQLRSSIDIAVGPVDILIMLSPNLPELDIFRALKSNLPQIIENILKSYIWAVKCFLDGMIASQEGYIVGIVPMYNKSTAANMLRRAITGFLKTLHSEMIVFNRSYISVTSVKDYQVKKKSADDPHITARNIIKGLKTREVKIVSEASESDRRWDFRRLFSSVLALILILASAAKSLFTKLLRSPAKKDITNQVALVTGGGMGLGREIALRLAKTGCRIAVADIDFESARNTVSSLRQLQAEAQAYRADISNQDDIIQLKADVQRDLGNIDILVNNAGLIPMGGILQAKVETIEKTLQVNLMSHLLMAREFLPDMLTSKRGHVVTISSIAGFFPLPAGIIYCTTKYGVTGFVDSLEYELKNAGKDFIKTTTIHPYFIKTRKDLMQVLSKEKIPIIMGWLHPKYVAKKVVEATLQNQRRAIIPNLKCLLLLQTLIPPSVEDYLTKNLLKNVADLQTEGNILT